MTKMIEYNNAILGKLGTGCIHGVMTNFMHQLDWAMDCPDQSLFQSMSVKICLE